MTSAPELDATQAVIPYLWAAVGGAFVTMGGGFLYLLGMAKDAAGGTASVLARVEETHGVISAHALDDARRFVERADISAIEGRIMGRFDALALRVESVATRVNDVAGAVAVIQGKMELREYREGKAGL